MLRITGPGHQTGSYYRLPMTDGLGPVQAAIKDDYVDYNPTGGTLEERYVRARMIASDLGGLVRAAVKNNWTSTKETRLWLRGARATMFSVRVYHDGRQVNPFLGHEDEEYALINESEG